jgi:hypothetical protein
MWMLEEAARFLFWLVCEVLLVWTGEAVLWGATFGRHRPRWDAYAGESPGRFVVFSEVSLWVGAAFWVAVVYLGYRVLLT